MVSESKEYELVPLENDTESWGVRILEGEFSETVIKFGNVQFEGPEDDPVMKFNFDIIQTPDEDLEVETNTNLQEFAREILINLLEREFK